MRQFFFFCISGGIGFLVDAATTQALIAAFGLSFYLARAIAFFPAVTATWLFNRRHTFRGLKTYSLRGEWTRYLLAMSGGASINYASSAIAYYHIEFVRMYPVLGVAIGALSGLVVNFAASRWWIFRGGGVG